MPPPFSALDFEPDEATQEESSPVDFQPEPQPPVWAGLQPSAEPPVTSPVTTTPAPQFRRRVGDTPDFQPDPVEAYLREEPDPNESELHKWARAYGVIFKNLPRLVGKAIGFAGKGLEAGAGKVAGTGDTFEDVISAVGRGQPLPVEEAAQKVEGVPGFGARAGLGILETVPKLGLLAAFPESLLAQSMAAGGIFGLDAQGNFSPKAAVVGALLPGAQRLATGLVKDALTRGVLGGAESLVKNKTAQWLLEETGRQAALNAVMIAGDSPELMELYKRDPDAAKKQLQEIFGQNLAWALFGAGRHFALGENTATSAWVEGQKRKYSSYFNYENVRLLQRGFPKAVDEVKETQANPPEPEEPSAAAAAEPTPPAPPAPSRPRIRIQLPAGVPGTPAEATRRLALPTTITTPLTPGAPYAINERIEPPNREPEHLGTTPGTNLPENAPEVRQGPSEQAGGGNRPAGGGTVAQAEEAAAELPVAPKRALPQGITEEDGPLFSIVGEYGKLPAFLPGVAWERRYAAIKAKQRAGAILSAADKEFLAEQVPPNYEDYWGDDFKAAYAAAKEAGIAGELFEPVKTNPGEKLNDQVREAARVLPRELSINELWGEIQKFSQAKSSRGELARKEEAKAQQEIDWKEATQQKAGRKQLLITPEKLRVGDAVVVDGQRAEVTRKSEDSVFLDGGERFGLVELPLRGEKFYAQKFEAKQQELAGIKQFVYKSPYRPIASISQSLPKDYTLIDERTFSVPKPLPLRLEENLQLEPQEPNHPKNLQRKREAFSQELQGKVDPGSGAEITLKDGQKLLVTQNVDPAEAAKWPFRVTRLLPDGTPAGHETFSEWQEVVSRLYQSANDIASIERGKAAVASEGPKPSVPSATQEPAATKLASQANRYRIKNAGPQTYQIVERLEQTSAERELGEQPVRVRNEATGDVQTILESDLEAVRTRTEEEKAAEKRLSKKELDDELRKFGVTDPSIFPKMADKRAALKRYRAKEGETFAVGARGGSTIEGATQELTTGLGIERLPENVSVVHQPDAPWGARIIGRNRIEINAARVRPGNVLRVALEEGLHGVWGDPRFVKEWKDISDSLTKAELEAERARREHAGLPADAETIQEEAAIRKLLETPESSWAKRAWTAIVNAFKRLFGIEVKPGDREVLLAAAREFLKRRSAGEDTSEVRYALPEESAAEEAPETKFAQFAGVKGAGALRPVEKIDPVVQKVKTLFDGEADVTPENIERWRNSFYELIDPQTGPAAVNQIRSLGDNADVAGAAFKAQMFQFAVRTAIRTGDASLMRDMAQQSHLFAVLAPDSLLGMETAARVLRGGRLMSDSSLWQNLIRYNDAVNAAAGRETGLGPALFDQLEATIRGVKLTPQEFETMLGQGRLPAAEGRPEQTLEQLIESVQPERQAARELISSLRPVERATILETVEEWRRRGATPEDRAEDGATFVSSLVDALVQLRLPRDVAVDMAAATWRRVGRVESARTSRLWVSKLRSLGKQVDMGASAEAILDRWAREQTDWLKEPKLPNYAEEAVNAALKSPAQRIKDEAQFKERLEQRLLAIGVPEDAARELAFQTWERKLRIDRNRLEAGLDEWALGVLREQGRLRGPPAAAESGTKRLSEIIRNAAMPLSKAEQRELGELRSRDPRVPLTAAEQARMSELLFRDESSEPPFKAELQRRLEEAGLVPQRAAAVAEQVYTGLLFKRAEINAAAIDRATRSTSTAGLIEQILSSPYAAQRDPAWVRQTMLNYYLRLGLNRDQAESAAKIGAEAFQANLLAATEREAERFLKGRTGPRSVKDIIKALRLGLYDPSKNWKEGIAARAAFKPLSNEDNVRLAQIEEAWSNPDLSPQEQSALSEQMLAIFRRTGMEKSFLRAVAENMAGNLLWGVRTFTVQLAPFIETIRNFPIGVLRDPANLLSYAKAIKESCSKVLVPEAKYSALTDSYSSHLNDMGIQYNELKRVWEQSQREYATGNAGQKAWARFKQLYGFQQYIFRALNTVDQAQMMAAREHKLVFYASLAFKEAGLTTAKIGPLVDAIPLMRQNALERALDKGVSLDAARVRANAEVITMVKAWLADAGLPQDLIDQAAKATEMDIYSMVGRRGPGVGELEEGLLSRPFNMFMQKLSEARRDGATSIAATTLLGFVSIPFRTMRYYSGFGPLGLYRAGLHHYLVSHGKETYWKQSFGNALQARQRLHEALAGTAALIVASAWASFHNTSEDEAGKEDFGVYFTGNGPTSKNLKDAWQKAGWKPYSIMFVIGGHKVAIPLTRVGEALMFPFMIPATLDDAAWKKKEILAKGGALPDPISLGVAALIGTHFYMMGQKGLLQGPTQFARLAEGGGGILKSVAKLASTVASASILPMKQMFASLSDMFVGPLDQSSVQSVIASNFPILGLPWQQKAVNRFADPLYDQSWYGKIVRTGVPIAFQVSKTPENEALYNGLLLQKGVSPPELRRYLLEERYGPLTDDQWTKFSLISGKLLKSAVVSDLEGLKSAPPEQVRSFLTRIATEANLQAASELGLERQRLLLPQAGGTGIATFSPPGGAAGGETGLAAPRLTLPRVESGLAGSVSAPQVSTGGGGGGFAVAPRLTLPSVATFPGLGAAIGVGGRVGPRISAAARPGATGRRRLSLVSGRLRPRTGRIGRARRLGVRRIHFPQRGLARHGALRG